MGGAVLSSLNAGGEGSISPIPVSPVPKLTRIPSSVSGGGGVEKPTMISMPNNNKCTKVVPNIPFLFPAAEFRSSIFNFGCNYLLLINLQYGFLKQITSSVYPEGLKSSAKLLINDWISSSIMYG
jgi:hypothetical protein